VQAGQRRMEPLWSPVVATGGNRSQIGHAHVPRKQAKTVAVGCDRLPEEFHGKEGVDGSSPSEGSAKARHVGAFPFRSTDRLGICRTCGGCGARCGAVSLRRRSGPTGQRRARPARPRQPRERSPHAVASCPADGRPFRRTPCSGTACHAPRPFRPQDRYRTSAFAKAASKSSHSSGTAWTIEGALSAEAGLRCLR
jgi:hypothetical protein